MNGSAELSINRWGHWPKLVLGFTVTVACFWLLAHGLDLHDLGQAFVALEVPTILLALVFLVAGYAVRIVRWWYMLRVLEPNVSVKSCVWPLLTSIAVNNVLPFRAGDALRVLDFPRKQGMPIAGTLGTLVVERVLDVAVLFAMFFLGLRRVPEATFPHGFVVAVMWLMGLGTGAMLGLILLPFLYGRIQHGVARRHLWGWSKTVSRHSDKLIEALNVLRSLPRALALLVLSAAAWVCDGAVFWIVALVIHDGIAPWSVWFCLAAGTLAALIPSAPGNFGTYDYAIAQGFAAYGAPHETAAAFALTVHAVMWTPVTVVCLPYLLLTRVQLRA